MHALKTLCLAAALAALTAPAQAALTYTASGSYALGSSSGPGAATPTSGCGNLFGVDAALFDGDANGNNVGIHAYSCDDSLSNFGSRSSGEKSFYAQGKASITGSIDVAENSGFSFFVNAGEVGAFGSTAFGTDEFQKSSLAITLQIDGVTYIDQVWSAEVLAGGLTGTSNHSSTGPQSVDFTFNDGPGFFSYGIAGGPFFIPLSEGAHSIVYEITSVASGNILSTSVCTGYLQSPRNQEARDTGAPPAGEEGPVFGEPFAAYCGAGARSGDPFPDGELIARALPGQLPEPMSAGLALTALVAAAGARRRIKR